MQTLSHQQIITSLKTHYQIEVRSISPLHLGADINASVFLVKAHDETPFFLKIRQKDSDNSVAILTFLQESGVKQIIPPIKTIGGSSAQKVNSMSLTLYPFIQGKDGFEKVLTETQWISLGKTLKQIHELHVPASIKSLLCCESFSATKREIVRGLFSSTSLKAGAEGAVAEKFQEFVEEKKTVILKLLDLSEHYANVLSNQSHLFVLCHSDIHGGNILMSEQGDLYIVDWDDAIMAPKERDLMFIGGGVGGVWNKASEITSFYQGYGSANINKTLLAYYRYERIIEDIAEYSQLFLDPKSQNQNCDIAYRHFIAQFDPDGVVEIAFKTEVEVDELL